MNKLPVDLRAYFQSACHGHPILLPPMRWGNRKLLMLIHEALQQEPAYTRLDAKHLFTLTKITDQVMIPSLGNCRDFIRAKLYLMQACPLLSKPAIQLALDFLLHLFLKNGLLKESPAMARLWLRIWETVEQFDALEQASVSEFVHWLLEYTLSARSIDDTLRELRRFKAWLITSKYGVEDIGNRELHEYLESRACFCVQATQSKVLGQVKTFLYYYQDRINGPYSVPTLTLPGRSESWVNYSANSEELRSLWQAVKTGAIDPQARLMLSLILGYGLPVKALPLLQISRTPGHLQYCEQLPIRQGQKERLIRLPLEEAWVNQLWVEYLALYPSQESYPFLLYTKASLKKGIPMSPKHCQALIKASVSDILGYPITINQIRRGSLKAMAIHSDITPFMNESSAVPLSKQTRLMIWLHRNTTLILPRLEFKLKEMSLPK